jgi:hypothetical protein
MTRVLLLAAALAAAACETTTARCAFTPCGGLLDGRWTIKDHCPAPQATCPSATVDASKVKVAGTMTFAAGVYSVALHHSGTLVATVPLACYSGAASCAAVETELRAAASQDRNSPVASVDCSGSSVCTCRETLRGDEVTQSGTYQVSESRVILTSSTGEAVTDEFCANDGTLRLRSSSALSPVAGAAPDLLDVLILQR